jgi:glutathionyl-hydroquinone reductase
MEKNLGTVREEMEQGSFVRQEDAFREWVSESGDFPAVEGRYHLYVSLACPWASRAVIVRKWRGLENVIGMTVVDPIRDEKGWAFREGPGYDKDPVNGFEFLSEAYRATDPDFDGRVTVPVLWDKKKKRIVNNSEDDICRMLNDAFREAPSPQPSPTKGEGEEVVGRPSPQEGEGEAKRSSMGNERDLFPKDIEGEHAEMSEWIYNNVNNGVYKAGFATRQVVYERECRKVFAALEQLEQRLGNNRYLFGDRIVEADWRLFCTLIRFDAVYHGHFKCNLRRIVDYKNLQGYLMDLYQQPWIAQTVNFDHIKRHYYMTHEDINPTRIVPIGPDLGLSKPHGRERMAKNAA